LIEIVRKLQPVSRQFDADSFAPISASKKIVEIVWLLPLREEAVDFLEHESNQHLAL
jgi:hypothetical protein